jgi:hypothetical protein
VLGGYRKCRLPSDDGYLLDEQLDDQDEEGIIPEPQLDQELNFDYDQYRKGGV